MKRVTPSQPDSLQCKMLSGERPDSLIRNAEALGVEVLILGEG
jgi:hypothetical protein